MTAVPRSDPAQRPVENVRRTATRLLGSTSKNSYDPELDIDWDAPVELDKKFMPYERVSLYGTELWERMTEQQRREVSPEGDAGGAAPRAWVEGILDQLGARGVCHQDPPGPPGP